MPLVHEQGAPPSSARRPRARVHPDEAVALGAALLAHSLGSAEGVVLIDVLPMSIGIGLPGGRFKTDHRAQHRRCRPASSTALTTTRDGQTEFELVVVQGESSERRRVRVPGHGAARPGCPPARAAW